LWFSSLSFHRFEEWLACEIEKAIIGYYFSPRDRALGLRQLTEFMKMKGEDISALGLKLEEIIEGKFKDEGRETVARVETEMKVQMQI
jgi:hypothetical protein